MEKNKIFNKHIIIDIAIFITFIIFAGIVSVNLGMERTPDTLNYHIYNPWAFLNNRIGIDIMPAEIQTYFNPLLDVPYYLMIKYFNNHPMVVTFMWGFSYALFLFMIYKISLFIFKDFNPKLVTLVSVTVASGTTMVVRHIGWLSHDILLGALALVSLYLVLKIINKEYCPKLLFTAGLIIGAMTGLKYTAITYSLPLFLTFIIFYKQFANPWKSFWMLTLGAVTGFLITDGFWMYKLYKEFHNPLFPYFNWIFHSDFINTTNTFSIDFENTITDKYYWLVPFKHQHDIRFKILYIMFFVNLFTVPFVNREKFKELFKINVTHVDFILLFAGIAFILWTNLFVTPRYYFPIVGMVCIITIIVLMKLFYILAKLISKSFTIKENYKKAYLYILLIMSLSMCFPIYNPDFVWGYRIECSGKTKLIQIKNMNIPDNSIVFVERGTAIAIPFQNKNAKYIGINSYRFRKHNINIYSEKTTNKIKELIKAHPDTIYMFTRHELDHTSTIKNVLPEIDKLGLKVKNNNSVKTNMTYLTKLEIK